MVIFDSFSAEDTARIAAEFGSNAAPGDIVCLSGPLGAGKTVFAKGFALGLGYNGRVTSPTFTIMQEYPGGRLPLYHFDLYRLEGGIGDLAGIGYEEYFFAGGVCLIEWPEMARDAIPPDAMHVKIEEDFTRSLNYRKIQVTNVRGDM